MLKSVISIGQLTFSVTETITMIEKEMHNESLHTLGSCIDKAS